jgi:hypothetical protein
MSMMPAMEGVANGALGGLASFLFQHRNRSHIASAARVRRIEAAAEALDRHTAGLGRLLHSPSLSNRLKALLLDVSDALEEQASAEGFVRLLAAVPWPRPHDRADPLDDDFADLGAANGDMAGVFRAAVIDGLAAALLRWPDAEVPAAKILADAAALTPADLACIVRQCFDETDMSQRQTEAT